MIGVLLFCVPAIVIIQILNLMNKAVFPSAFRMLDPFEAKIAIIYSMIISIVILLKEWTAWTDQKPIKDVFYILFYALILSDVLAFLTARIMGW